MSDLISKFYTKMTVMGKVLSISVTNSSFTLILLTNDKIKVRVTSTTWYEVLRNVGDDWRDRVMEPDEKLINKEIGSRSDAEDPQMWDIQRQLLKYIKDDQHVCIQGVYYQNEGNFLFEARRIFLMHYLPDRYGWEDTHWWIQQINTLFEQWLDVLFDTKRQITTNDFAEFYRTDLDFLGGEMSNSQECATLSRFLYGLSSSYLLTGNQRALSAARACARYLVSSYSSPSHDGEYVFWKFGRVKDGKSTTEIIGSLNPDDKGSFPLYEQIYVLSGLTQYYRITQDTWILGYIIRTIAAFERFYLDVERPGDECYQGNGGYFSHIDPVTMRPDSPVLEFDEGGNHYDNRCKKNWNSIGDHIPAYLINLLVSIDPLPATSEDEKESWMALKSLCQKILDDCVENILEHFKPEEGTLFVNERFHKDWTPDQDWGWQKNRGIVGHNLKISWNLTRCAHYYVRLVSQSPDMEVKEKYTDLYKRCYEFSIQLGKNMRDVGFDLIRGGIFDALERFPNNDMPTEFTWGSTKDFWQQEQAILAYYIMHGIGDEIEEEDKKMFLDLARYCSAFWNLFFIDQENRKIYFRTSESGDPMVKDGYGIQGGHAIAGYHAFELNYLAHLYIQTYVDRGKGRHDSFVLYYSPMKNSSISTLNVMPEFFRPKDLIIINIKINGMVVPVADPHRFQIDISSFPENPVIMVEYLPSGRMEGQTEEEVKAERISKKYTNFCFK